MRCDTTCIYYYYKYFKFYKYIHTTLQSPLSGQQPRQQPGQQHLDCTDRCNKLRNHLTNSPYTKFIKTCETILSKDQCILLDMDTQFMDKYMTGCTGRLYWNLSGKPSMELHTTLVKHGWVEILGIPRSDGNGPVFDFGIEDTDLLCRITCMGDGKVEIICQ